MNKIIKGDQVVVITGKDKGKQGQVVRVLGDKVVVEGVNVVKRHQKPNPMRGIEGGIITKEMPLVFETLKILKNGFLSLSTSKKKGQNLSFLDLS